MPLVGDRDKVIPRASAPLSASNTRAYPGNLVLCRDSVVGHIYLQYRRLADCLLRNQHDVRLSSLVLFSATLRKLQTGSRVEYIASNISSYKTKLEELVESMETSSQRSRK
jgi:hypothetical protein